MIDLNENLLNAIIREKAGSAIRVEILNKDILNKYKKTDEFKLHKEIYMKYGGLDFCFDSAFLKVKLDNIWNDELMISHVKSIIEEKNTNFMYKLSDFILYSKGYKEGKEIIKSYGLKIGCGGICSDYINNNKDNAYSIATTKLGEWIR